MSDMGRNNQSIDSIHLTKDMSYLVTSCLLILGMLTCVQPAYAVPASVYINQAEQEYDGTLKFPGVTTDPLGLDVEVVTIPRRQSEIVFQTIPAIPDPSYTSIGLNTVSSDKAWGNEVNLGGSNRVLESVDIALVNWAKGADYPLLVQENPLGYLHPLTVLIYGVEGVDDLVLLEQHTQESLIPWRPETLDDGSEYPLGGIGFTKRFNFNEGVELPDKIVVLLAYNTQNSGFEAIGVPGPYNQLNVAFGEEAPFFGSDSNSTEAIRFRSTAANPSGVLSRSGAFGAQAPLFTVRTLSSNPTAEPPRDAGGYQVIATITEDGYEGDSRSNFEVTPLEAELSLDDLRQVADGSLKSVSVITNPLGLSANVKYAQRSGPPTERGLYAAFATLPQGNYTGKVSGTMRLGYSYDSWIAEKVSEGNILPEFAGRNDDPDGDHLTNFMEYLASLDPAVASSTRPQYLELAEISNGIVLTFDRNNEAVDIDFRLQSNRNLSDPEMWASISIPAEAKRPFVNSERIQVMMPMIPEVRSEFFRLQYILKSP